MRFQSVWELAKAKNICEEDSEKCKHGGCGQRQPVFRKEGFRISAHFKSYNDVEQGSVEARVVALSPDSVLKIFRSISDADIIDLGLDPKFARPEWMILTALGIPPMTVRPSISVDGLSRGEDDLTHKLMDVIKANNALQRFETEVHFVIVKT